MAPNVLANVTTRRDIFLCPQISRQMSRHVFDIAPAEIQANVERDVATSVPRAKRRLQHTFMESPLQERRRCRSMRGQRWSLRAVLAPFFGKS